VYAALTVRRLKAGSFDDWRRAWEPDEWPEGSKRAYILRNVQNPDEVIAFGFFEGDISALRGDERFSAMQRERFEKMAEYVESTGADGIYEVVEEVTPTGSTATVGGQAPA
jgi:hypothetical protein